MYLATIFQGCGALSGYANGRLVRHTVEDILLHQTRSFLHLSVLHKLCVVELQPSMSLAILFYLTSSPCSVCPPSAFLSSLSSSLQINTFAELMVQPFYLLPVAVPLRWALPSCPIKRIGVMR